MATLTGEAKQFLEPRVLTDLGVTALGLYGTHLVANKIPFGAQTGWPQVLKLAGSTAGLSWLTSKFRPQWAEAVFTGGGLLTIFEVIGLLTHGAYGLSQAAGMAGGSQAALPGTGPAMAGSPKALPSANPNINALNKSPNAVAVADAGAAAM